MRSDRAGFTLFEVAVSLLVLALGVLAVVALLPRCLEQLNLSRQRLYAASIAMDLSSHFTYGYVRNNKMRADDYHTGRIAHSPDIERCANSFLAAPVDYRNMAPVPPEILLRLDSDDDTIRNLVRDGIPVFYPLPRQLDAVNPPNGQTPTPDGKPLSAGQVTETAFESQGAELGQIIFAVVGLPQLNATYHAPRNTLMRRPSAHNGETRGRSFPAHDGGGYADNANSGRVPGQPISWRTENSRPGAAGKQQQPTGLSRGVMPRKGYFWDYAVRSLDFSQPWAYDTLEDRGVPELALPGAGPVTPTDSLFQPFSPDERGRMIIFWSVNWKSYEDAEEALPADCDISAFSVGHPAELHSKHGYNDGVGHPEIGAGSQTSTSKRFPILWRGDDQIPDTNKANGVFVRPGTDNVTWSTSSFAWVDVFCAVRGQAPRIFPAAERTATNVDWTSNWWFDRNFNRRYDVGPVPRGTRMRARTIARYVVYDPRLNLVLR